MWSQGMPSTSYAADMLGSQANETVLIEQPQAYITQKARVKRNRRTEWDYYVQFPGFPEDEGNWYSARAIKTQHPRGAELIREFEHPDDAADVTPLSSAPRSQPTQQAVPFTQDAGPSQIGSLPMHVSGALNHFQQPHTQDQFASQLQQPAEYRPATFAAPKPGFHLSQAHGLHPTLVKDAFNTASQNNVQPQLHWSFDRLQQASEYKPAHSLPPSAEAPQVQQSHTQYGAGRSHTVMPMQAGHAYASTSSVLPPAMHAGMRGQASDHSQGPAAQTQQPGWGPAQQTNGSLGLQSQWPAGPPRPGLGAADGASAQPQLPTKHMLPRSNDMAHQLPNQMPLQYQQHPVGQSQQMLKQLHMQPPYALQQQPAQAAALAGHLSGQQNPQPALIPAASLNAEPHMPLRPKGLDPTSFGSQVDWTARPSDQHAAAIPTTADASAAASAGQAAQLPNRTTVSAPLGDATSQILGQQANQWRQAASKKGSSLLDLVPTISKQLAPKMPASINPLYSSAPGQARVQLDAAHQDCEAFRPAVQECIAAAGLPLSKPFYQQALDRAEQQRAAQTPAHPSSDMAMQEQHVGSKSQDRPMPDASAVAEADTVRDHTAGKQCEGEEHQQTELAAFQAASPMLTDDSGLGMDIVDEVEQRKARKYMSARQWPNASITGRFIAC
ncbi:TPA: hypothetical protein ACH3X1_002983 [Trebouxia sp. C0004]